MVLHTDNVDLKEIASRYGDILTHDELRDLVTAVYRRFSGNTVRVIGSCSKLTRLVAENTKFLDVITDVTLKTRLKYLLDGVYEIPLCRICGKPACDNVNYICKPVPETHSKCAVKARTCSLSYVDRSSNCYYKADPIMFERLYDVISENMRTFVMKLKSMSSRPEYEDYSDLARWVDSSLPLLTGVEYDYPTKCRWILEGRTEFPVCPICGKSDGFIGKRLKINVGYQRCCSMRCSKADPGYWKSVRNGCLRNNGVSFPMQNSDIAARKYSKYSLDGVWFDSSPEVIAFVFYRDNVDRETTRASHGFEYEFDGSTHFYTPDLYLPSTRSYIEIKGAQFFNEDGTMRQPFRRKGMSDVDKALADAKEETKRKCMMANGVKLIVDPSPEMTKMKSYVKRTYGKDYVRKLKTKRR